MSVGTAYNVDKRYVVKHTTWKGIQMFSLLAPPILAISAYRRPNFVLHAYLRKSAMWTFGAGSIVGAGLGLARLSSVDPEGVSDRAARLRANVGQVRTDDYSTIGAVVGGVTSAAILYGRVPLLLSAVPGGAALGIAGGVLTHLAKSLVSKEEISVGMMVEEAKEGLPLKKVAEEKARENE